MKKRVILILFTFILMSQLCFSVFAFDFAPSSDKERIEKIIKLPEVRLDSDKMLYLGANIPYYQIASSAVYSIETMKNITLPKPDKKYFYPVLLSEDVMNYLNQLEQLCDKLDTTSGDEKTNDIRKIAQLLAQAENAVTNQDLSVIRGFDQMDYAFSTMMYHINQLSSSAKKEIVYELADLFHKANLATKIRLSKAGAYDVGLLEKQLGFFLFYYGSVYDETAFFDVFRFHSNSQLFVPNEDNSIQLDERIYSINDIYAENEKERQRIENMKKTPNSSIYAESTLSTEQIAQMQKELDKQGADANANLGANNTKFVLENGICYEYGYKIVNGKQELDKKWKLSEQEQYYCSGGLDGTASVPGGADSMKVHQAKTSNGIQSKLMDSTTVQKYKAMLNGTVLVFQYKNQTVQTEIPIGDKDEIDFLKLKHLIKTFALEHNFGFYDDENQFLLYADGGLYNFYIEDTQKEFKLEQLRDIVRGLLFLDKKEREPVNYEDTKLDGITNLKAVRLNQSTTYLQKSMLYDNGRLYIPEKEFIKAMRVEYASEQNEYLLYDKVTNKILNMDINQFSIKTTEGNFIIPNLTKTENNQKYIDIISVNRLLGRDITVQDGILQLLSNGSETS